MRNTQHNRGSAGIALIVGAVVLVVLVVAVALLVGHKPAVEQTSADPAFTGEDLGGASGPVIESTYYFKKGISLGDNVIRFAVAGTIQAGTNQASWRNTTGRTVYIDLSQVIPSGNASSSMRVSIGTSTASSITNNYTAPYASLVDNYLLATSTGSTIVVNSTKDAGTNGRGAIQVPNGTYVNILIRQDSTGACTGAACEAATSTNRGFSTAMWRLEGLYKQ